MCMRINNKYRHNFDAETDGKLSFTRPAKWGDIIKFELLMGYRMCWYEHDFIMLSARLPFLRRLSSVVLKLKESMCTFLHVSNSYWLFYVAKLFLLQMQAKICRPHYCVFNINENIFPCNLLIFKANHLRFPSITNYNMWEINISTAFVLLLNYWFMKQQSLNGPLF
jgi:hypothetical protein